MAPGHDASHEYASVDQEVKDISDDVSESDQELLATPEPLLSRSHTWSPENRLRTPLILSSFVNFALLFCLLFAFIYHQDHHSDSYTTGFSTDFSDAAKAISLTTSLAKGRINFDRVHHEAWLDPISPRLFGPPTPGVDQAWDDLMEHEFFDLTPSEGTALLKTLASDPGGNPDPLKPGYPASFAPSLFKNPRTGMYQAELGVYHTFHCLNMIRQLAWPEYYNTSHIEEEELHVKGWAAAHREHCFENVFHAVKCQSDLTPVPMYKFPGMPLHVGVTMSHTCRDFDKIHEWARLRRKAGGKDEDED